MAQPLVFELVVPLLERCGLGIVLILRKAHHNRHDTARERLSQAFFVEGLCV